MLIEKHPGKKLLQAMDQLVKEGKITYVGSSNFAGWNIVQAQYEAQKGISLGLYRSKVYIIELRVMIELEVIPACREFGLGPFLYPIAGGLLAGSLRKVKKAGVHRVHSKGIEKYETT
jgi:aryl-alcohol dehydrogenase-like predicted oxidoreductase